MKKTNDCVRFLTKFKQIWIIMKLCLVFIVCFVCVGYGNTTAQDQRVTLDLNNASLSELFNQIHSQTGLRFLYNSAHLSEINQVNIHVNQEKVGSVLDRVFKGSLLAYECNGEVILIMQKQPQAIRVKGFVYDIKKQPIPGVTVKVVGLAIGSATDSQGWFAFDLPLQKGSLEFSCIGYQKQIVEFTNKSDTLHIQLLEEVSNLDEVVVRAYGTQKKRETISAISSVKAEEMKELPAASVASMLQGRLAGVNIVQQSGAPGSAAVIAVRGFNSLFVNGASDGQPLWVVDGVPMHSFVSPVTGTNTLADLDPSLIESVEVLKDAAAASIYGSRAGNGVILVTTKKGKIGKATFTANVSYSLSQLAEYPTQTGGRMERWLDLMQLRNEKKTGIDEYGDSQLYFPNSYESVYIPDEDGGRYVGSFDAFWGNSQSNSAMMDFMLQDSLDPYYNNSTNWWKYAFHTGKVLNANISASGGSERIRYMVGLGYYDEKGIMINSQYSRVNLMSNITANLHSKLKMDTRVYLAYIDKTMNGNTSGSRMKFEGLTVDPKKQNTYLSATKELENAWMQQVNGQKDRTDDYRAMVSSFLEYNVIKGLDVSASVNVDFSQGNQNLFTPSYLDVHYKENRSEGAINRQIMLSTEELIHYQNSIKDVHNFDILLGFNANKEQSFAISGWGLKGPSDDIFYYNPDKAPEVVDRGWGGVSKWESTRSYRSDFKEKRMMSYFGRLGYNYKQKYLFEATFRRDGSSTFGEGNRWANFPSFALGWTFSEEPFIKNWAGHWLNWGKIRFSYGTSGQVFSDAYLAHGLMSLGTVPFLGNTGVTAEQSISPELTWEKTEQYDVGLDFDMFNYRINLKLDYYYKYTKALMYEVFLPGAQSPFASRMENAMEVSNEGLEIELQADIFRESAVSWRTKFNFATNRNKFEKSYSGKDMKDLVIGRPLYGLYVYAHNGFYASEDEVPRYYKLDGTEVYTGGVTIKSPASGQVGNYNIKDFNNDNTPDLYYAGSPLPKAHGGWINEISWKGFDLNILFNYTLGRKIINARVAQSFKEAPSTKMFDYRDINRWTSIEKNPNLPEWGKKIIYDLDSNIEKVHSVSLKQLTLGYNLPTNLATKAGLSGVRLFLTGENLFYLSNYSEGNPEVINLYDGIDKGDQYPIPRKWTLGLTLNF